MQPLFEARLNEREFLSQRQLVSSPKGLDLERRLAAILAADVVGYTRLMGRDEARTLQRLTNLRQQFLEPIISNHHGRVVKLLGDGLLVEFASAVDALNCALAWQKGVADRESATHEDELIVFRIGINVGDVIVEGDDIYGDGVNIASRLEALSDAGGICLSDDAHRQVRRKVEAGFEDLGDQNLKHVAEPVRVYRVVMEGQSLDELSSSPPPPIVRPSIAVLTFEPLGGDEGQSDFCSGLAADIITELSRSGLINVVGRHESQSRSLSGKSVQEIGRILAVRYLLSGTVRRSGDRGRITAELLEVETARPCWSQRYDRSLGDFFAAQDELARAIVGVIEPAINRAELARISRIPAGKLQPHELLLRAWRVSDQGEEVGNRLAQQDCEEVLRFDPENSDAQMTLAHIQLYAVQNLWTDDPAATLQTALNWAERAWVINPKDYDALGARGMALLAQGKYDSATQVVEELSRKFPGHDRPTMYQAFILDGLGHHERAFELIERAIELNPNHDQWDWLNKGKILFSLERYNEAVLPLEQCKALSKFPFFLIFLSAALAACGRDEDARAEVKALGTCAGKLTAAATYFYRDPTDRERLIKWGRRAGLPL